MCGHMAMWSRKGSSNHPSPLGTETAVSAQKATIVGIETEEKPTLLPEKEKRAIQQQETPQEEQPEPEIGPIETPVVSELQSSTGQAPAKNSAPEPTPPQPPKELQPGDKVYVAGFGWVEYEVLLFLMSDLIVLL